MKTSHAFDPRKSAHFFEHPEPAVVKRFIQRMEDEDLDSIELSDRLSLLRMSDGERRVFELQYRHRNLLGHEHTESRFFDASGRG